MKNRTLFIAAFVLLTIAIGVYYFYDPNNNSNNMKQAVKNTNFGVAQEVVMYKSPTCGCCAGYANELEKQGFEVEIIMTENMDAIKEKYGISQDKQSCYTVVMNDYFIEGHVPMEAVEKLLKEQPEINGIGLPRMPAGTPGMGGMKRAPYEVYKTINGEFLEFITI